MMVMRNPRGQYGLTLIEVMLATVLSLMVMLALGILFVDAHKGWLEAFEYVYGDVPSDAHVTDITFDRTVRKSSQIHASIDPSGQWVLVKYYKSEASPRLDEYAKFYLDGTQLKVDRGDLASDLEPGDFIGTDILAEDVTSIDFALLGAQVQMRMEMDNGRVQSVMTSSAMMHNK
jgi:hypothetical protein